MTMKKRILLLSVLMTLGLVTFFSSCGKDEDTGICVCEIYYYGEYTYTEPGVSLSSSECSELSKDIGQGYYRECYLE